MNQSRAHCHVELEIIIIIQVNTEVLDIYGI